MITECPKPEAFDVVDVKEEERARLERIEAWLLCLPIQAEYDLTHSFAPGIYVREITMRKEPGAIGTLLIGHEHTGEHFNFILSGRALVSMEGKTHDIIAPCYFKSGPGVRKVLFVLETMRWATIHPNKDNEQDIEKLEERLIRKSRTFLTFEKVKELEEFKFHTEQFKPVKETLMP